MCRFFTHGDDFFLVKANQRAENRHIHHHIGRTERRHRLAGDLPDRFAGNQRLAVLLTRHLFGNAHHEAAHDERRVLFGALFVDSIWILVNGTMWTRMPQQLSDKMRAKSSTFSFARSDV